MWHCFNAISISFWIHTVKHLELHSCEMCCINKPARRYCCFVSTAIHGLIFSTTDVITRHLRIHAACTQGLHKTKDPESSSDTDIHLSYFLICTYGRQEQARHWLLALLLEVDWIFADGRDFLRSTNDPSKYLNLTVRFRDGKFVLRYWKSYFLIWKYLLHCIYTPTIRTHDFKLSCLLSFH